MCHRSFLVVLGLILLVPTLAPAGALPATPDAWTEYATSSAAEADGWERECGIAQLIVVDSDHAVGDWSVGCEAQRAYWCDTFGLAKATPLAGVTQLRFWHVAPWSWNFGVRLYMQPTVEEAAQGVTEKYVGWNFTSQTDWAEVTLDIADGEWSWYVGGGWQASGYSTTLTEMTAIRWNFCSYFGVAIGDRMLIDGLRLITDASPAPLPTVPVRFDAPYPNPSNPGTVLRFQVAEPRNLRLVVYDLQGRRVRIVTDRSYGAGVHETYWDGRDDRGNLLPAATYLACLEGDGLRLTRKVVLVQ